jgi:hypothetical protein
MTQGVAQNFGGGQDAPPQIIAGPFEFGDLDAAGNPQIPPAAAVNVLQLDPRDLWNEGVVPAALMPIGAAAGAAPNTMDVDLRSVYNKVRKLQFGPD